MLTGTMSDIEQTILAVIARTPDWLRNDLVAEDRSARTRAEETLAAMIAAALAPRDAEH